MRNEQGFSLIELITVVTIIGVLAAIALPSFAGQRQSGFDASAKSAARTAQGAVERLALETGDYGVSRAQVVAEAPDLEGGPALAIVTTRTSYAVTVTAEGKGHTFAVQRSGTGTSAERTCAPAGESGCGPTGSW